MHPWASTAALAGHCALNQSEDIFWKFHDAVYDDQDLISAANASSKMADIAVSAGADLNTFQACLADPKTEEIVRKSTEEGQKLEVTGTPTTFVNGRRIVGPDQALLEQYIHYDLGPNR
jgi:protein-disulfide isomerase